jgi:two-component system, LytTR family, response regulator
MTAIITCCIIDDAPKAAQVLEQYIATHHRLQLVQSFTHPLAALAFLRQSPPQLLFCDIDMPGMNGIELVQAIRDAKLPIQVIFTTAYSDHAAKAYRLFALDYLLKPISKELFLEAVQRAIEIITFGTPGNNPLPPASLLVKTRNGPMQRVIVEDIQYIEVLKHVVTMQLTAERIETLMSLADLEQRLSRYPFIRVHKSYLVAEKSIDRLDDEKILLTDGTNIPLGRSYKDNFIQHFS